MEWGHLLLRVFYEGLPRLVLAIGNSPVLQKKLHKVRILNCCSGHNRIRIIAFPFRIEVETWPVKVNISALVYQPLRHDPIPALNGEAQGRRPLKVFSGERAEKFGRNGASGEVLERAQEGLVMGVEADEGVEERHFVERRTIRNVLRKERNIIRSHSLNWLRTAFDS